MAASASNDGAAGGAISSGLGVVTDATFHRVCDVDDLWRGEIAVHEVGQTRVLLVHTDSGTVRAVQLACPHQRFPMSDGSLEGDVLTCARHLWQFNVVTGAGVNPTHAQIALYPVKIDGGKIYVSLAGVEPKFSRP